MSKNSSIRGIVAKSKGKVPQVGRSPEGKNPVLPLQKLDPRIPLSTGMVPQGFADDLRVLQGLKKASGPKYTRTVPKMGPKSKGETRIGEVKR